MQGSLRIVGYQGERKKRESISEERVSLMSGETSVAAAIKESTGIWPSVPSHLGNTFVSFHHWSLQSWLSWLYHFLKGFPPFFHPRLTSDGVTDSNVSRELSCLFPLAPPASTGPTQELSEVQEWSLSLRFLPSGETTCHCSAVKISVNSCVFALALAYMMVTC